MEELRLDKMLCDRGGLTRSAARELIRAGRITVDGVVERSYGRKLSAGVEIRLDGKTLEGGGPRYIMLNKPAGTVSSTRDRDETVLSLLPEELALGLFPVGRLDKDVTGLLILTDDGEFCHRATSPRHHVTKVYEVEAAESLTEEDAAAFEEGLVLGDGTVCRPARLKTDGAGSRRCLVEISEGMYHQVKRMFASRGKPVVSLRRTAMGGLALDPSLAEGEWRYMTQEEAGSVFAEIITK